MDIKGQNNKYLRLAGSQPHSLTEAELCLFRANKLKNSGRHRQKSIVFCTTHKCASTFVSSFLPMVALEKDMRHVDYARLIYRSGNKLRLGDAYEFMTEFNSLLFSDIGDIYGPMRKPFSLDNPDLFEHVYFLRDPRDVLISSFFSFGFSHGIPPNSERAAIFLKNREKIKSEGIDQYCIRAAHEWILPVYSKYRDHRNKYGGTFLKYEDFVYNTERFSEELMNVFKLTAESSRKRIGQFLLQEEKTFQSTGDIKHKRSGKKGQFLTELKLETQKYLDDVLREEILYWQFDNQ